MPKDDFDVIAYKILLYYYACLKRTTSFDILSFDKATSRSEVNEGYFTDIIIMLADDGYLSGVVSTKVWGNEQILANDFDEYKITSKGIDYLNNNDRMKKVQKYLLDNVSFIASLIKAVMKI